MVGIGNWGAALWNSFTAVIGNILAFLPRLLGFLVILLVGWIVAKAVEKAVTYLLRRIGFDRISERIGMSRLERRMNISMDAAGLLGRVAFWFVFLIFLVPAVDALGLSTISALLSQIIGFIPNVFVAIVILFLGALAAYFVAEIVRATTARMTGNPNLLANIARYAILGFAALIALEQLGIAGSLLNILFMAIMGGLALAFGLAFGLGGRDAAQRLLGRSMDNMRMTDPQLRAQTVRTEAQSEQARTTYNQPQM